MHAWEHPGPHRAWEYRERSGLGVEEESIQLRISCDQKGLEVRRPCGRVKKAAG